jgi:hypothetical protein
VTIRATLRRAWYWLTHESDDLVEESTRLRIQREAEDAERARRLRDQIVVPKPRPESAEPTPRGALSKPWGKS